MRERVDHSRGYVVARYVHGGADEGVWGEGMVCSWRLLAHPHV